MSDWNDAIEAAAKYIEEQYLPDWVADSFEEADSSRKKLAKEIRSLKRPAEQDGWIPIESAPEEREVLLYEPYSGRYERLGISHKHPDWPGGIYTGIKKKDGEWAYSFMGEEEKRDDYFGDYVAPTHWRPLPSAPTPEAK